jgi:hypothetical protein
MSHCKHSVFEQTTCKLSTLSHDKGNQHDHTTITDNSGRPQYVVEGGGEPLRKLV